MGGCVVVAGGAGAKVGGCSDVAGVGAKVGFVLVRKTTLVLGTALPPGAALAVFVEFVSGQLVTKFRAGITTYPSQ